MRPEWPTAPGASPAARRARRGGRARLLGMVLAGLTAGLAGCGGPGPGDERPIEFETISLGVHSGVREPLWATVRDAETWGYLWGRHAGQGAEPPQVDFSREMVFAYFSGERRTAGYRTEILAMRERPDMILAVVLETAPPPESMTAQVLTQPHHIVRLSRSPLRVAAEPVSEPPAPPGGQP